MIIERASGKTFAASVRDNILEPLGMESTGLDSGRSLIPNRAQGYDWSFNSFVKPSYLNTDTTYSAGGMYSTTGDMLLWDQALYTENLASKKTLDEIFAPTRNGYGYGWQMGKKFDRAETHHSGSVTGYSAFIYRFPVDRVTVIVLSNSDRTSATKVATNLAAIVFDEPYELPRRQVSDLLVATFQEKGVEAAVAKYRELERSRPAGYNFNDSESTLNRLAYDLLDSERTADAIAIFELNVERFPQSANRLDSLADGYLAKGDTGSAIKALERSLALDPENAYAAGKLRELKADR